MCNMHDFLTSRHEITRWQVDMPLKSVSHSINPLIDHPLHSGSSFSPSLATLFIPAALIYNIHLICEDGLKCSYDNVISAVDIFFDQWDPRTSTPMEDMCGLQGWLCWKINLILSHFMRVSWSAYEPFSRPLYVLPSLLRDGLLRLIIVILWLFLYQR